MLYRVHSSGSARRFVAGLVCVEAFFLLHLHSRRYSSQDGVLSVQPRCRTQGDEELSKRIFEEKKKDDDDDRDGGEMIWRRWFVSLARRFSKRCHTVSTVAAAAKAAATTRSI